MSSSKFAIFCIPLAQLPLEDQWSCWVSKLVDGVSSYAIVSLAEYFAIIKMDSQLQIKSKYFIPVSSRSIGCLSDKIQFLLRIVLWVFMMFQVNIMRINDYRRIDSPILALPWIMSQHTVVGHIFPPAYMYCSPAYITSSFCFPLLAWVWPCFV